MTIEDDYRGMRNPYHLADLEDLKKNYNPKDWKSLTNKENELIKSLKGKYKGSNIDVSFISGNLFDPKGKGGYSSPLYPWVDQWWD